MISGCIFSGNSESSVKYIDLSYCRVWAPTARRGRAATYVFQPSADYANSENLVRPIRGVLARRVLEPVSRISKFAW